MNAVERYRQRLKQRLVNRMRQADDVQEASRLATIIYTVCYPKDDNSDGGPGSGNWGHESIPGVRGGSKPGGGKSHRQGSSEKGYTSEAKEKKKAKQEASSSSSSSVKEQFRAKLKSEKETLLSKDTEEQAQTMFESGFLSEDEAISAMDDGSISKKVDEYYSILEQNGDTTSTKPLADNNGDIFADVFKDKKYPTYDAAKEGFVKDKTGLSDSECKEVSDSLELWCSNGWESASTSQVDKFIENDSTYDGEIYRGLHFQETDETTYDDFMSNVEVGSTISGSNDGKNSSWSSDKADAQTFSRKSNKTTDSVVIKCVANRTSSPIAYINSQGEKEVVAHSRARWTVINVQTYDKGEGGRHAEITVIETGEYASDASGDGIMKKDSEDRKTSKDTKPMSMLDRWEASSKDFVVTPPKKLIKNKDE